MNEENKNETNSSNPIVLPEADTTNVISEVSPVESTPVVPTPAPVNPVVEVQPEANPVAPSMPTQEPVTEVTAMPVTETPIVDEPKKKKYAWAIILVILMLLLAGAMVYYFYFMKEKEEPVIPNEPVIEEKEPENKNNILNIAKDKVDVINYYNNQTHIITTDTSINKFVKFLNELELKESDKIEKDFNSISNDTDDYSISINTNENDYYMDIDIYDDKYFVVDNKVYELNNNKTFTSYLSDIDIFYEKSINYESYNEVAEIEGVNNNYIYYSGINENVYSAIYEVKSNKVNLVKELSYDITDIDFHKINNNVFYDIHVDPRRGATASTYIITNSKFEEIIKSDGKDYYDVIFNDDNFMAWYDEANEKYFTVYDENGKQSYKSKEYTKVLGIVDDYAIVMDGKKAKFVSATGEEIEILTLSDNEEIMKQGDPLEGTFGMNGDNQYVDVLNTVEKKCRHFEYNNSTKKVEESKCTNTWDIYLN